MIKYYKEEEMKRFIFIPLILLALILAACRSMAAAPEPYLMEQPLYEEANRGVESVAPSADMGVAAGGAGDAVGSGSGVASIVPSQERMVIQNADLSIIVKDPEEKMNAVAALASELGGFVVSMNMYQTYASNGEQVPEAYITIRVPAEKLDQALQQIKADAVEVTNESRSGQDVTQEYTDLASRLDALEAAEQELVAIMEQAKNNPGNDTTTMTQDVLTVYNRIIEIREQIEQIKGMMQYYEQSSDMSAINATLVAEETVQPIKIGPWTPVGAFNDAIQALINFFHGFVDFIIWLIVLILPMLIVIFGPIGLIVWGIVALVKRSRARKEKKTAGK
jgi:hypothetical protein